MKKLLLLVMMFFALSFNANAQELGVRWGNIGRNNDFGLDAVVGVGQFKRVHADISFGDDVGFDALYDFLYKPMGDTPLNWYVGAGPSFNFGNPFWFGVSAELGLEYRFARVPIVVGVDYRPTFWIVEESDADWGTFGVNLRYAFGGRK